jgi:uncharacterized protein (DUF433 family)
MAAINIAVENAQHYSTKRQLLGIIAGDFPPSTIHAHFPGVTDYQIKAAKKHAHGSGK